MNDPLPEARLFVAAVVPSAARRPCDYCDTPHKRMFASPLVPDKLMCVLCYGELVAKRRSDRPKRPRANEFN